MKNQIFTENNLVYGFIFFGICLLILWFYNRIRYINSNYGKFEYYLYGERSETIAGLMLITELLLRIAAIIAILFAGGWFIKYLEMFF